MARRLKTLEEQSKGSMKLNFHALKYLPRFFKEVRKTNPTLFLL